MIPLIIQDQFFRIQNLQKTLFHKPATGQELFFAISYSKLALAGLQISTTNNDVQKHQLLVPLQKW